MIKLINYVEKIIWKEIFSRDYLQDQGEHKVIGITRILRVR